METFSGAALLILGMVAFANYRNKSLGPWLKAKFLNAGAPDMQDTPGGGDFAPSDGTGSGSGTAPRVIGSTGLGGALGALVRPVNGGTITGRFGEQRPGHIHEGVDIAEPTGTPVDAARAGTISFAGPSSGYGLRVDVDHGNGISTRYAHLSRIDVHVGQTVDAGGLVGLVGATGDATGPHLHFELRDNGVAIDPSPYLGAGVPTWPPVSVASA